MCESKHCCPCGADGRSLERAFGRSVYGHVITKFSGMGRFIYLAMGLRPRARFARAWSSATTTVWDDHALNQNRYFLRGFFISFLSGWFCFFLPLTMLLFLQLLSIWYSHRSSARFESIHINSHKLSRDWRQELYSLLGQPYYAGGGRFMKLLYSSVNSERGVFANFQPGVVLT